MTETDPRRRLEELEKKLAARRAATVSEKSRHEEHYSQAQIAWRMVTEMVAGLGIGFGIGFGLDRFLNTGPWFMLVFTLLGIAAGINVMIRTAREMQVKHDARDTGQTTGAAKNTGAARATDKTDAARVTHEGKQDGD